MVGMASRPLHILASTLVAGWAIFYLVHVLGVAAQPMPTSNQSPDPSISQSPISNLQSPAPADVIILLPESADLTGLADITDETARRRELVARLQATTSRAQEPVLRELTRLRGTGQARNVRPLWIINAVAATLSPEAQRQVAAIPGVRIVADARHDVFGPPPGASFAGWAAQPPSAPDGAATWSIESIRAPHVWNLLGIDGQGVTVAIVDTGVDWQHPALRQNYRGGQGDTINHVGNWFSAVQPTQTTPVDLHGHGTHVAATAVGQQGLGVAPGAQWIAVGIADANGAIRDSAIHAAFQWLLAPDDRPELAPDVVNNSWGTAGDYTAYVEDVRLLNLAGIISVFAAGNTGPGDGSINAPASYPGVLSVAATDPEGSVTWFSSRGPSPLTAEPKPLLAAPGVHVLSAYPDGRYAMLNGTSMATPHVVGTVALMLAAEPRLTAAEVSERLAAAAGNLTHDTATGWGTLDAYAAVSPLAATGAAVITIQGDAGLLPGAVLTVTAPSGARVAFVANGQGRVSFSARPGMYQLRAAAFGYQTGNERVTLVPGHVATLNIQSTPLPTGSVSLILTAAESAEILQGAVIISADGQPIPVSPLWQPDGRYHFTAPVGRYTLEARVPGYRLGKVDVTIRPGDEQQVDSSLARGPRLLLVDSGSWQYRSQATFYEQALADLGYHADRWAITDPYHSLPDVELLQRYDAVLWTAPNDSPGAVSANDVITDFLGLGGRLLVAGQNVGSLDGAPAAAEIWWSRQLGGRWLAEASPESRLIGAGDTPFAGLLLTLNGADSARNQTTPDKVWPLARSLTRPMLTYSDGSAAALLADRCQPFRLLYMGFGLEGVTGRTQRAALMAAILETLLAPEAAEAGLWQPEEVNDFALAGNHLTYTLTLRNLNRELTQTFNIDTRGGDWPRTVVTPSLAIGPCDAARTGITVNVPAHVTRDQRHILYVQAIADGESLPPVVLTLTHKTPGAVLLVDDDRFQQAEAAYQQALAQSGLTYDLWETGWSNDVRGSPRAEFLQAYDLVVWFTGYDWFQPILPAENEAISRYLEGGGRLFLSSQDYLARNGSSTTAREYFGVASYQESITPTLIYANNALGIAPSLVGHAPLDYGAYQNYSDGIIPGPGAEPFLWHNQGAAAGAVNHGRGVAGDDWRAVFLALPFEALADQARDVVFRAALDQLSATGDVRFAVDHRSAAATQARTYTLTVVNDSDQPRHFWLTNTLPAELNVQNIVSTLVYDHAEQTLRWNGIMAAGESRVLTYTATVDRRLPAGRRIDNSVTITSSPRTPPQQPHPLDDLAVARTATTWIYTPDLSHSTITARTAPARMMINGEARDLQIITYTLTLHNDGPAASREVTATLSLPQSLHEIQESALASAGDFHVEAWRAFWSGSLAAGETVTATVAMTRTARFSPPLPAAAYIADGVTDLLIVPHTFDPLPYQTFLPIIWAEP